MTTTTGAAGEKIFFEAVQSLCHSGKSGLLLQLQLFFCLVVSAYLQLQLRLASSQLALAKDMSQGNVEYLARPSAYLQIASLGIVSQFRPIRISCQIQSPSHIVQQLTLECQLSTKMGYPDIIVNANGCTVFSKRLCWRWDLKGDEVFECDQDVFHAQWMLSQIPLKIKKLAIVDGKGVVLAAFS